MSHLLGMDMGDMMLESLSFFTTCEDVEEVVAIKPVEAGDGLSQDSSSCCLSSLFPSTLAC